ncbi:hypothetical protein J8F10_37040 [Gemmata sp. G18]|uniref:PepSY domain-containing protein n=1 Tax=Gemmata palustris TaxID=2822762 RepID=A0ABS5C4F4_9BACT|nr:hypothetical protein [Gemmata palustris]MBP3960862.1 hypothetical protein [Gemmata palustris]
MGNIVFTPESGPSVVAEIHDGKYSAEGVPTGDVKVSLDLRNLKTIAEQTAPKTGPAGMAAKFGKMSGDDAAKQKSLNPGAGANIPPEAKEQLAQQQKNSAEASRLQKETLPLISGIPEKYSDPNQSGWTVKVSRGDNTFDAKVTK